MANRDYMRNPQHWINLTPKVSVAYITTKDYTIHKVKINPVDVDIVGKYRWYMKDGYAVTSISYKRVKMHHLIMGKSPKGKQVDHIDRDRLNNTRENLRFVTSQQNHFNTEYKGTRQRGKRWTAQIQTDGKTKHLGTYDSEDEARQAYLQAKSIYHVIS